MALLWLDGFDTYSAIADVVARYPGLNVGATFSTTLGRFGGGAVFPTGNYQLPINFAHTTGAVIFGGAWLPSTTNTGSNFLIFWNAGLVELSLLWDMGIIRLYRGNGTTLIASSTATISGGNWHHLEVKATVADSGGSVEIRSDGITILSYTGDTKSSAGGTAGIDRVSLIGATTNGVGGWDDVYVLDTAGSTLNNWLGDCRINTLAPTSDASVQFTRSTGASNYLTVDEGRQNGDTDYVESATVGHIDRYGYADLPASVSAVHAVQATTWARKTDAATRTMRNLIVAGGSTGIGSTVGLTTGYAPIATPLSVVPGTGAVWTPSDVNALTAGFEVVS